VTLNEILMSTSPAALPDRAVHPLKNAKFRLFWIGLSVSLFGDQFYLVALPWLILQLTGSSLALGTILMAAAIPRAVLMLMGGAVTDRASPRKIMMATASTRTLFVAAIAALIWLHVLNLWHIYFLAFGFGAADAFSFPAAQAFLPSLVEPEQLVGANSALQSTVQLATIAGPAPAGVVVRLFGTAWAFFLDAVSFLFIIGALWRLPDPVRTQTATKPGLWSSIGEGLKYVNKDTALRTLLLLAAVLNFCLSGPIAVGLAYMIKQRFASPTAYGIAVSAVGAGGLVGSLTATLFSRHRRSALMLGGSATLGICTASIGLLKYLWLIAAVLFIMGLASGIVNVHINSWFQQRVDRAMLGRVVSVLMFAAVGLLPVSLAVAGVLVQWSIVGMYALAGASVLAVVAVGTTQRSVRQME
jgi:MFS family permease